MVRCPRPTSVPCGMGNWKPGWVLPLISPSPSRVQGALKRPSLPHLEGMCPFWTAQPMASAASFHSSLEDTQHLLTQHCYILDGVILYGIDSYALWGIYNIPFWDSLGDNLRNHQNCLQTSPWASLKGTVSASGFSHLPRKYLIHVVSHLSFLTIS